MDLDLLILIICVSIVAPVIMIVLALTRGRRGRNVPGQMRPTRRPGPPPPLATATPRVAVSPVGAPAPMPRVERKSSTLNLDAGAFKPISGTQAAREAEAAGSATLFANLWFGRRDLIPPADDPRTSIIDRAMVGHGLITPEELVEIHKLGEQMDLVRPDLAQASHQADRAVRADKESREQLKQRKKEVGSPGTELEFAL